ncbi:MAG: hypothetical protein AB201_01745 [Parcubacteria bacterium C7867-006]|nr:MAG: hypothetical protein AB201_01745 [Parcubacteria bacterium C7867-006]
MEDIDIIKAKEQLEELKTLINKGKQDVSNIESMANKANSLIAVINDYNTKFELLRTTFDDPSTGIISNLERSKNSSSEIDKLKVSSEEQLGQIKTSLATVQQNIQQMNVAYEEFKGVNSRMINPESGIEAVLNKATQVKAEIDKLKVSSEEQLGQIGTALATVQQNIQQMKVAYEEFLTIKKKIDDPEGGIKTILVNSEAIQEEIEAVKKQSDVVFLEIKTFRDESQNYTKEIENLRKTSIENKDLILSHEKESTDLKDKIKEIYKIATDSALANSFDQRKVDLQKSSNFWYWSVVVSTAILLCLIIWFFWHVLRSSVTLNVDGYLWYRLTLTSPLIFFITFATFEYSKERNYLEKYAFKSATALSLHGYTTLLINTFGEKKNEEKILDFVLNSMTMIYQEPYEPTKESKFSLGFDGKFASLKGEITKTMKDVEKEVIKTVKEEITKNN